MSRTASFRATLWEHDGPAGWHFVTLPADLADAILDQAAGRTSAFGSVPVEVRVGASTWRTSLFPDRRTRSYLLPVRASIRRQQHLQASDTVTVGLLVLPA